MSEDDADTLDADEREDLLEDVQRKSSTIGERIPETVDIEGTAFPLREFVWETKRTGRVPPDRREEVRGVRQRLENERERRYDRLRNASLTVEEGEELVRTIIGLDRAITALSNVYESDIGRERHRAYIEDNRRWLSFIDELTE